MIVDECITGTDPGSRYLVWGGVLHSDGGVHNNNDDMPAILLLSHLIGGIWVLISNYFVVPTNL
jgi:hypothetical protein